jgi:DNA uptake protein ComE-like DNA-binding protein
VGAQAADRIIAYREEHGPIHGIRQLRQADVVSVAVARQIRDLVRF